MVFPEKIHPYMEVESSYMYQRDTINTISYHYTSFHLYFKKSSFLHVALFVYLFLFAYGYYDRTYAFIHVIVCVRVDLEACS